MKLWSIQYKIATNLNLFSAQIALRQNICHVVIEEDISTCIVHCSIQQKCFTFLSFFEKLM
jgi:hypothetical protein